MAIKDVVVVGVEHSVDIEAVVREVLLGGSGFTYLFGTWIPITGILIVLCLLDILTGLAKGWYDRNLISRKMSQGMITKAMMFVVIIIANMVDVAMFESLPVTKTAVITFYIGLEGLSILENLGQMNVPLPPFIKERLSVLQENGGKGK
jgi:toxin secretion/phage lysis holin